jgi:hypothetical protein
MRFAWRHRCSGFFDYHGPALYTRPALAKALPDFGSLEGRGCGTSASSSSIPLGVNFLHGFSTSIPVVSYIHRRKRSDLRSRFLMVFQTAVVPQMGHGGFSPSFLLFAVWGHRRPRDLHAGKWKSAGDSFWVASCSSPLTGQTSSVIPSHRKSNGHDGAIWTSSALHAGVACL